MTQHLNIHNDIKDKLAYFYKAKRIPNILFHGRSGSGKRTILNEFIELIYESNKDKIKRFVMTVDCAYGKGIKFIREDLKFFAKTHIQCNEGDTFKSIILYNADNLTIDAQSALRRCIEIHNHTTRFFIIASNKYKILRPILSRFCEIYICRPLINNKYINLHNHSVQESIKLTTYNTKRIQWLKKELVKPIRSNKEVCDLTIKLYEKAYTGLDLLNIFELYHTMFDNLSKERIDELVLFFQKIRHDMKNERMFIFSILHLIHFEKQELNEIYDMT